MVGCGQTSATWLPSTMPSPPSTGPSDARERRSSAFIREVSQFLRQVDLASARESLCRGLGSRWFTERFHRNALVTHFQHGQVFCTARQLKDYAVTPSRLHQPPPQS